MLIPQLISDLTKGSTVFTDIQARPGMQLYFRSPGGYFPVAKAPLDPADILEFAEHVDKDWEKKIDLGDGQFDVAITEGDSRLRCNFFRYGGQNQIGVVIRRLPKLIPTLEEIGVPVALERILELAGKGLILITGPTGSGKSTTLAAMLEHLNKGKSLNIITIEQPIEYEFEPKKSLILQREVPTNVSSFAKGLEAAKRQDPDVIMIGEMRDQDTVSTVLQAAYSGHLVIATSHARSAQETCESILSYFSGDDLNSKRSMLANSLLAIASQVLISNLDSTGLVLASDLLINNQLISNQIKDGKLDMQTIANASKNADINARSKLLNDELEKLVSAKKITRKAALEATYDRHGLEKILKD